MPSSDSELLSQGSGETARPPARKGIQSVVTGFRIIDFLVEAGRPLPLKDIARGTGLASSKLHFYLVSLVKIGVLIQEQPSGRYGLGPYTMKLGIAGLEQFDIFRCARDDMIALAHDFGHTLFLGVWGNHGPTIVFRADGYRGRSVFELRVGSALPVLRSALGRLFLAHLPEAMTHAMVESELADVERVAAIGIRSEDLPGNRAEVRELITLVREQGVSRCRSGLLSGYTELSAPVFDNTNSIIAALTIMGQIGVLDDSPDGDPARAISSLATRISKDAGQRTTSYIPYLSQAR